VGIRVVTSGDAVDVALFNHDLGTFATSSIQTFGSTVTRAVDNITLATSAFPLSATEHTLYGEGVLNGATAPSGHVPIAIFTNSNDRIVPYLNSTFAFLGLVVTGGVLQANTTTANNQTSVGAVFKTGAALQSNDLAAVINGDTPQTDASLTLPSVTTLGVGRGSTVTNGAMTVRKLVYLPRRMTNAELQTLTTL
jgi:hypothetical protein